MASLYDIFVSLTDNDILLPDSKFYSMNGCYVMLSLLGYDKIFSKLNFIPKEILPKEVIPEDVKSQKMLWKIISEQKGSRPSFTDETHIFYYIIGLIYLIFGYFPLGVRILNVILSVSGAYLLFKISRRHFGEFAANAFLLAALFLPTQFGYSITMSRDFLRMFVISFILWVIYG